ncbi:hypothetical protein [Mycolicibacter heraklionensis]|uniref:hypothetical protein n=1 Tax=Mycolicibacter heraklionensis TaxID=512402 RepID=UPI0007EC0D2A|nr:hypothetical protein [Mycolicibacter heraklionensis]OBG32371.1 hypothetical protein A5671_07505 [Mycolicibacter heraklionensis]
MAIKNTERFAAIVRDKVSQLGLTQTDIHSGGGPSDTTLRRIMAGEEVGVSLRTLSRLDTIFKWEPGSAARTLAGGDPTPVAKTITGAGVPESFRVAITPTVGMEATDHRTATPYDGHFERAERLLRHSQESIQLGDYLGAIHILEGLQSTTELLIDRITDQAMQVDGTSSDDGEPGAIDLGLNRWLRDAEVEDSDNGADEAG